MTEPPRKDAQGRPLPEIPLDEPRPQLPPLGSPELLEESVQVLRLSVKITNQLESLGVLTIEQLLMCTVPQLQQHYGFGVKTMEEIFAALAKVGFRRNA